MKLKVEELRIGTAVPFGPRGEPSAIDKQPVTRALQVTKTGLIGDVQADTRHHGGLEKAIHAYPRDHYPKWMHELPDLADRFSPGAFGENLVLSGVTEADICIGDVFRLGTAEVEVSQGRQPCWKLNTRFGLRDMARRVQDSGRSGWYFRIRVEGTVAAGDELTLTERPNPDWSLARISHALYKDTLNLTLLAELANLSALSTSWRKLAEHRLARKTVEGWSKRLDHSG